MFSHHFGRDQFTSFLNLTGRTRINQSAGQTIRSQRRCAREGQRIITSMKNSI